MAYAVIHHFPDGTQQQYEASLAAVHPARGQLPEGQLFHAAGPVPGGWTIVAVHDSKASWDAFNDRILMPRLQAGIEGGFPAPPDRWEFEVYNLQAVADLARPLAAS